MNNTVLRNIIFFYASLIFISMISLIYTFFNYVNTSAPFISQIFLFLKPILSLLLFIFAIVLIYFFRNTMRPQQFFFSAFLLSSSILPLVSSILEHSHTFISTGTLVVLVFNFFYIVMLLFLFCSAITYHYSNTPLAMMLFFFILIISAIFVRYGLLVSTTLNEQTWYFLGGITLFTTIVIILYAIIIVLYIFGLRNFEIRKTAAYIQTTFLFSSILLINIITFSIKSPYVLLGTTLLLIISLCKYLQGYFYHVL